MPPLIDYDLDIYTAYLRQGFACAFALRCAKEAFQQRALDEAARAVGMVPGGLTLDQQRLADCIVDNVTVRCKAMLDEAMQVALRRAGPG